MKRFVQLPHGTRPACLRFAEALIAIDMPFQFSSSFPQFVVTIDGDDAARLREFENVVAEHKAHSGERDDAAHGWIEASRISEYPKLHSGSMKHVPLILALPDSERSRDDDNTYGVPGYYLGGLIQEWRYAGSNSAFHPTHFMPMPKRIGRSHS